MTSEIVIERPEPGIAEVWMRDDRGKNALGREFVELLELRLRELGEDRTIRVAILRGLPDVWCSGGSKDMLREVSTGRVAPADILLPRAVLDVPVPMIAAVEGHAIGGGFTLAMCCDVVLLGRTSRYGLTFMNMGFTPGMGTTRLLEGALGPYIAAEMMFSGQFYRGAHFEGRTAINGVLPKPEVLPRARELAARMAEKPRESLVLLKRSLTLAKRQAFEQARTMETFMHELSFGLAETQALIEDNYEGS